MSNILITSLSKKVPFIEAVRFAMSRFPKSRKLIGSDVDSDCIGRYFVDQFWHMPRLDSLELKDFILYCHQNDVTAVIPTRDGELLYFSEHRDLLKEQGVQVMISSVDSIKKADDKLLFFETLTELNVPVIQTSKTLDALEGAHFVVKERFGAGSLSVGLNLSKDQASTHAEHLQFPIYQPYIEGQEISVDLYLNRQGKAQGIVLRTRDKIVSGESQITTTFKDERLESQCVKLAEDLNLYGHVMFQLIEDQFLECNPRFGGASTLSCAVGLDSFYWFLLEVEQKQIPGFDRLAEEKKLVRYPKDLFY